MSSPRPQAPATSGLDRIGARAVQAAVDDDRTGAALRRLPCVLP